MSKYKDFLNFMYNDLGVTKEDIKQWTQEAVRDIATNYVQNQLSAYTIQDIVKDYLNRGSLYKDNSFKRMVAEELTKQIEINIIKEEE